jgi:four helix bundle protein
MSESIICERAMEFAVRALVLCDKMSGRGLSARHVATQLVKCATSIGSNAEEAREGQSKKDYIAKMAISRKEARETRWWLRLAVKAKIVTAAEVEWETSEANQLLFMIRAAIRTAQSSLRRTPALSPKLSLSPRPQPSALPASALTRFGVAS